MAKVIQKLTCKRCGHQWFPRTGKVYRCPSAKCQSFRWDEDEEDGHDPA